MTTSQSPPSSPRVCISGGGLAGLLLAVALKTKLGLDPIVYEQAPGFEPNVGGAIGLYPNGLRIIRDISPSLLRSIRTEGLPYLYRRWMRHDGSEIAVASEKHLCDWDFEGEDEEIGSIGIRRWKLQRCFELACQKVGIQIVFGKRVEKVVEIKENGTVILEISGGVGQKEFDLVFGCDGVKSATRSSLFPATEPSYTGITCLMGASPTPRTKRGICFPSSSTSKFHACYYPTGPSEQIFQIYFPTPEKPETWKALSPAEGAQECKDLAARMKADGWAPEYTEPLLSADSVLRVGLRARKPIPVWHKGRVILLGDAAHPPVPYIGQGAMMALEDVGILVTLLKTLCWAPSKDAVGGKFCFAQLEVAVGLYEKMRVPRTTGMLENSMSLGQMQLLRASNPSSKEVQDKEASIVADVKKFGTLPIMKTGASYHYLKETLKVLEGHVKGRVEEVEGLPKGLTQITTIATPTATATEPATATPATPATTTEFELYSMFSLTFVERQAPTPTREAYSVLMDYLVVKQQIAKAISVIRKKMVASLSPDRHRPTSC
ncbi:hypothetical protein HDV05_002958 [Chytridiales sp. JEL 0842]|nr:hypothetical protein HDV05_002958 [Chytridiales sp. JEL 0842]